MYTLHLLADLEIDGSGHMVIIFNIKEELKKMERHVGNGFPKSVSVYIPTMIMINKVLCHNSRSTHRLLAGEGHD